MPVALPNSTVTSVADPETETLPEDFSGPAPPVVATV